MGARRAGAGGVRFTIREAKVTAIDLIADPERLARTDLVLLGE